ncbi:hypothetical protein HanIR_Chr14g0691591 [Helianthus annuus]|nr:hypothetical protein HanIR_Chr14g0691591 [Helianthus annuus]
MVYEGFTGIRTKIKLLAFKLLIKRQGIVPDVIIYGQLRHLKRFQFLALLPPPHFP